MPAPPAEIELRFTIIESVLSILFNKKKVSKCGRRMAGRTDLPGSRGRMREAQGRDAGASESADEELQATIARWFGTLSSIVIPLTMLDSTRLRGMSNVTPTDQSAGPVHGWSISTLVRQATIGVSDRDTETIKRVAISSLTASTLPSRP